MASRHGTNDRCGRIIEQFEGSCPHNPLLNRAARLFRRLAGELEALQEDNYRLREQLSTPTTPEEDWEHISPKTSARSTPGLSATDLNQVIEGLHIRLQETQKTLEDVMEENRVLRAQAQSANTGPLPAKLVKEVFASDLLASQLLP